MPHTGEIRCSCQTGIGRATSIAFVHHGIRKIALLDINPSSIKETKGLLLNANAKVEVLELPVDVTNEKAVVEAVQKVVDTFGQLTIAVNNAGLGGPIRPTAEMALEDYRRIIDLDLVGLWVAQREEIKHMLQNPLQQHGYAMLISALRSCLTQ